MQDQSWHIMNKILALASVTVLFSLISFTNAYATLGEDWNSIKNALSDAEKATEINEALSHLNDARAIYTSQFRDAALENDPESNDLIENAFADTEMRLKNGDIEQASLNRQIVDKTIYKIAFLKIEKALDEKNVDDLVAWFDVMEKKFKISEKDFVTNNALVEIQQDSDEIDEYSQIIKDELLGIFKLKTIEEIEEAIAALDADNVKDAKKFAYEGLYYYRTLHPSVVEKLGAETADELLHEMEEVVEVTTSDMSIQEMIEELEHIAKEVELIIREYEGGDVSEIGIAISGIKDRLNLVKEEYMEAVSGGIIVDQVEYDETVVFLNKAIEIFGNNKDALLSLSESDAMNLEKNLNDMKTMVESFDDPQKVSSLVDQSLVLVGNLQQYSGSSGEITSLQYIDEIERLLNEAKIAYRNGDSSTAFDLATEAYLDNYEFVEAPLAELDPELMVKIEIAMREDLRNMINAGTSPDRVDAHIDMILEDLKVARAVVPEFGSIAVLILVIATIATIMFTFKHNKFGSILRV